MTNPHTPMAIVIRYTDVLGVKTVDTIAEHNRLFDTGPEVWIGKFGKPIAKRYINLCHDASSQFRLILVTKRPTGTYEAHITRIIDASREPPPTGTYPSYYGTTAGIGTWLRLAHPLERLTTRDLSRWVVASSGFSLTETLGLSMSGLFYAYVV